MNDPTTIQAEADARIDHYREALNKQARDIAALRVENQHLRAQIDDLRRAPTLPAPPLDCDCDLASAPRRSREP